MVELFDLLRSKLTPSPGVPVPGGVPARSVHTRPEVPPVGWGVGGEKVDRSGPCAFEADPTCLGTIDRSC